MPEGDTVYRTARTLRGALAGKRVVDVSTGGRRPRPPGAEALVGQTVADVEARGKHLLHWFDPSGVAIHTHLRMTGSWHLYRAAERWRKPQHLATLVLRFDDLVAVCFTTPVCEVLSAAQVAQHPEMSRLGPDALDRDTDLAEARRRLDARGDATVGEALLDQAVLAGIGNVYKNEVLFLHGIDPWMRVRAVPDADRDALLATAERLLKRNVAPGSPARITTTTEGPRAGTRDRLHVYGKAGRPCPRCGTPIRVAKQGRHARITYWCPRCQGPGPT